MEHKFSGYVDFVYDTTLYGARAFDLVAVGFRAAGRYGHDPQVLLIG
jgi:hypothetical protein